MDKRTAHTLRQLNNRFYDTVAASFSDTRQAAWPGWRRLVEELRVHGCLWADDAVLGMCASSRLPQRVDIADAACGNLRFERFLEQALPDAPFSFTAVDDCDSLVGRGVDALTSPVSFVREDLVSDAIDGRSLSFAERGAALGEGAERMDAAPNRGCVNSSEGAFDLVVCFGFFHHIPGEDARAFLLDQLIRAAKPGAFVAVSLWRFMDDERLAAKARAATRQAFEGSTDESSAFITSENAPSLSESDLDDGDYLLGWQDVSGVYRYCNSFTDGEIDGLIRSVSDETTCISRYRADGKAGNLNEYLLFRVDGEGRGRG